ncbi:type IV toxin-antitoxin system AbiEi family antitoxin domain-containing protein [Pseudonocardia sp.]|uniref:type IV toxin-antitoxin system AbiEi family antitoxin domain-containing protein n=1 Tax=Pseudonocardia sp. TaxID=60912 RepID=UPI002613A9F6|nr:type IV toxin-antitoxin system AbiEi family antitoxin domain-containing protein [Pseudonocardia sp.]
MSTEIVLSDLGAGQWGLVTAPQARAAGLSRVQLSRMCSAGLLVRLAHGVYALRGAMGAESIELYAAWLALDPARLAVNRLSDGPDGPVVSHASAAAFFGFGDLDSDRHEFTVPARKQTRRPDLRLHRGALSSDDVVVHRGLPVTTPARTVVDLLTDGHDGGHVAGVLAGAIRARQLNVDELRGQLAPFAVRFGFRRHDGEALLQHLLELGGVAEQVDADALAEAARAATMSMPAVLAAAEIARSTLEEHVAPLRAIQDAAAPSRAMLEALSAQLAPSRAMLEALSAQLAPSRAMLDALDAQAAPFRAIQEATAPSRAMLERLNAQLAPSREMLDALDAQMAPFRAVQADMERIKAVIDLAGVRPRSSRRALRPEPLELSAACSGSGPDETPQTLRDAQDQPEDDH